MAAQLKIPLPEKHGSLQKKSKNLGKWVTRFFKVGWETDHAVLTYANNDGMSNARKLSLAKCTARKCPDLEKLANLYCLELEFQDSGLKKRLYASSVLVRDEWVDIIRKYAVQSSIENSYSFSRTEDSKLGVGSFATVYKAMDRITHKEWALKEILKKTLSSQEVDNLKNEVKIGFMVGSHPSIVYMKEFVENPDRYYFVLEYMSGGELFDRIVDSPGGHFTETDAATLMCQLMDAVAYLHSKGVAHRDICPKNFLLSTAAPDAQVKIGGFCFACIATGPTSLKGFCGSAGYLAPEIITSKEGYGLMVDIWSMGVILYILLTGIPPYAGANDEDSFKNTEHGYYDTEPLEGISSGAKDLVAKMLTYRPAKRITAEQVLAHSWLCESGRSTASKALAVTKNLRSCCARMRLKRAIFAVLATIRLLRLTAIDHKVAVKRKPSVAY